MLKFLFMPLFDAEGGAAGAGVPEGTPSQTEAGSNDLMDEGDWNTAQEEADAVYGAEAGAEDTTPEDQEPAEPKPATTPEKVKIKVNGQDMELTREELVQRAQMGVDYERIREQRDRYMHPVEMLARQAGLPVEQFLPQLVQLAQYNTAQQRIDQLKPQIIGGYMANGYDQETAESFFAQQAPILIENEMLRNAAAMRTKQTETSLQAKQARQARINADIAAFEKKFPNAESLPDEVISDIRKGASPVEAYQGYLLRENGKKLKAFEQNTRNKENSPGSVNGTGGQQGDPFLAGFMG